MFEAEQGCIRCGKVTQAMFNIDGWRFCQDHAPIEKKVVPTVDTLTDQLVAAITGERVREVVAAHIGPQWPGPVSGSSEKRAAYLLTAIAPEVRARVRAVLEEGGDE